MSKIPAFQFYPGDWRKDPNLSRATLAAKGAMIEIMCLAFECEKRGVLKTGNKPWTIDEIAMAIGGHFENNKSAIQELLDKKILKKDRKGAIFSQRMCKDEKLRKVRRDAGLKGGNPFLLNQKDKQTDNQNTTPSASASSSASINTAAGAHDENKIIEFLRGATNREFISDYQIVQEAKDFKKKYDGMKIGNLRTLCNTWANGIKPWQKKDKSISSFI